MAFLKSSSWDVDCFIFGYAAKFEASELMFAVGEYWDSCNYSGYHLDKNQDSHRQRIINWIDGTGGPSTAFDFTTKGTLQEAVKGLILAYIITFGGISGTRGQSDIRLHSNRIIQLSRLHKKAQIILFSKTDSNKRDATAVKLFPGIGETSLTVASSYRI